MGGQLAFSTDVGYVIDHIQRIHEWLSQPGRAYGGFIGTTSRTALRQLSVKRCWKHYNNLPPQVVSRAVRAVDSVP